MNGIRASEVGVSSELARSGFETLDFPKPAGWRGGGKIKLTKFMSYHQF